MARSWLMSLAMVVGFPAGGYCQGSFLISGGTLYWRALDLWSNGDKTDIKLPTVQEFAAANMSVQQNATEFTLAFHVRNINTAAWLFRLTPPGFNWSQEALEQISTCALLRHYPAVGFGFWGKDCAADGKGPACAWLTSTTRLISQDPSPVELVDDLDVRNGVHVAFVQKGALLHLYLNGKYRYTYQHKAVIQPYLCFGGSLRFDGASGFIRDFRVYTRALDASEVFQVSLSCDGISSFLVDDPSFGYEGSEKTSETCMDYYTQMRNGFLFECPRDAQDRCPVSCSEAPLCSPPSSMPSIGMGLRGPQMLCLNTNQVTIDEVLERCKQIPPFNESWAQGKWPSVNISGRRLGHIPDANCPGGSDELDPIRDMRVVHNPECDFLGENLSSALLSPAYSIWWWVKRESEPGVFTFYHSTAGPASAGNIKQSALYAFSFQDDKVWLNRGWEGAMDEDVIEVKHVDPPYAVDPITNLGRGRWVFKAMVVDGPNTTHIIDDAYSTKSFRPKLNPFTGLDSLWFGHGASAPGPSNFSDLRFSPSALTVQQLQQIYHRESSLYFICPPGQFHDRSKRGQCSKCAVNTFSSIEGAKYCEVCPSGTEATALESTLCTPCQPGKSTASRSGQGQCLPCAKGTFAAQNGTAECKSCPTGSYADEGGMDACKPCGGGSPNASDLTTIKETAVGGFTQLLVFEGAISKEDCGCKPGMLERNGKCQNCGEGMECPGRAEVIIKQGYYSAVELSVYKCRDRMRCPGGRPGATCAVGRKGIACWECQENMAPRQSDGTCQPCEGDDTLPLVLVCLASVPLIVALYWIVDTKDHTNQSHVITVMALSLATFVTAVQQFGIIALLWIDWPDLIAEYMKILKLLTLDLELVRLGCVASLSPFEIYSLQLLSLVVAVAMYCLVHVGFVIICHSARFYDRLPSLIGGVGQLFTITYVSIAAVVIAPMQCQVNPNGVLTVRTFTSVACWETGEHISMVVLAGVAMFIPLGFLAWCVHAVYSYPSKMQANDVQYLRSHTFLFFRFHPNNYSYALVPLCRSLLISCIPLLPTVIEQISICQAIMVVQMLLTLYFKPWRAWEANALELVYSGGLLLILRIGSFFSDRHHQDYSDVMAFFGIVLLIIMVLAAPLVVVYQAASAFVQRGRKEFSYFLVHHKAGGGSFARLLKMFLVQSSQLKSTTVTRIASRKGIASSANVFLDSDNLQDLCRLFEYVGRRTEVAVIICSPEVLKRHWCIGEIVTVTRQNVSVIKVILPGFREPDESFIMSFQTLVPDFVQLSDYGMSLDMVQNALQRLRDWPCLPLNSISQLTMRELTQRLQQFRIDGQFPDSGELKSMSATSTDAMRFQGSSSFVLVDHNSLEAVATAHVLAEMLKRHFAHDPSKIPIVVPPLNSLPEAACFLTIICTNGAFTNLTFLSDLIIGGKLGVAYVLVLAEESFRFPTEELLQSRNEFLTCCTDDVDALNSLILDMFNSIGVVFQPSQYISTDSVLEIKAKEVADRLLNEAVLRKLSFGGAREAFTSCASAKSCASEKSWKVSSQSSHSESKPLIPLVQGTEAETQRISVAVQTSVEILVIL